MAVNCPVCRKVYKDDKGLRNHWGRTSTCMQAVLSSAPTTPTTTTTQTNPEQNPTSQQDQPQSSTPSTPAKRNTQKPNTPFARRLKELSDRTPTYSSLLPEYLQFFLDEIPPFKLHKAGPPKSPPVKPETNPSLTMIECGYILDAAATYERGDSTVVRGGSKAYIRLILSGATPGVDYELVDKTGTRVKMDHVWFYDNYSHNPGDTIATRIAHNHEEHVKWLDTETKKYDLEIKKWKAARLDWEASLAVNCAWNGVGEWKLQSGPTRILALGGYTGEEDYALDEPTFRKLKEALIDLAINDFDNENSQLHNRRPVASFGI
ncbi:MAG: hypothetical protein M1816_004274 [Peltula sp. TS41687]|nr:MAG: hypothetical protein M1816_004274 [Peltula sp. TS41687]